MKNRPKLFNQSQAAEYLTENGIRTDPSELSLMGKYGSGPRFERVGRTKIFFKCDLDGWVIKQKEDEGGDTMESA